jgi:hypothetical protein
VVKRAPSRLHANVVFCSIDWKVKLAFVEFVKLGGACEMVVAGPVKSIIHARLAGVGSVFPAVSVARTWKVRLPPGSPV